RGAAVRSALLLRKPQSEWYSRAHAAQYWTIGVRGGGRRVPTGRAPRYASPSHGFCRFASQVVTGTFAGTLAPATLGAFRKLRDLSARADSSVGRAQPLQG